jgi:hypothetical protein
VAVTRHRSLEQLYKGPQVLEAPLYSVFEASRYLQVPENTLRSWVWGRSYVVITRDDRIRYNQKDLVGRCTLCRGGWDTRS